MVYFFGLPKFTNDTCIGKYFEYDQSDSYHSNSIQSDQLAGHHYLRACNLESYCPSDQAETALRTIHKYNVMCNGNGYVYEQRIYGDTVLTLDF